MTAGVYLLRKADEVVYVGQSRNVKRRLTQHRRRGVDFDTVEVIETPVERLKAVEQEYILKHRPKLNGNGHTTRFGVRLFFDSSGVTKSSAERQRENRERLSAAGLRQRIFWLNDDHARRVKRLVRWMHYRLSKDPNYQTYVKSESRHTSSGF